LTIEQCYSSLEQIRVYVLSDRVAKSKNFKSREVSGKTVKLEVMDIERLFRHWSEGKPRDELIVNFEDVSGTPLPCIYVPGQIEGYDYTLTVINGEALRFIYEKYGPRLLEANVRSFLSSTGKINKGIRDTLKNHPEKFMAYNNGIVIVADEIILGKTTDGGPGIAGLKGMQIVNGGQTTASIYFSKKKFPEIDLSNVRVPAKIIILNSTNAEDEESLALTGEALSSERVAAMTGSTYHLILGWSNGRSRRLSFALLLDSPSLKRAVTSLKSLLELSTRPGSVSVPSGSSMDSQ